MRRVGIDVGGTFTDVVMFDEGGGSVLTTKVPTTPADPTVGALDGLRAILALSGAAAEDIGFIGHGTTIATNMVIEGKGAKTGLITTRGFRDILELRRAWRHDRADLYDLFFEAPRELVPRRLRAEVTERTLHDGTIETALDEDGLMETVNAMIEDGVEAIALVFLNSPANAANERRALELARERVNRAFITGSIEVNPEIMEYERTSTTAVNAILGPRCATYATQFTDKVRDLGIRADIYFMQSNGGLTSPEAVAGKPVTLLESGPAGGVTAVARLCERMGVAGAICGDMGGTSFDVSLVRGGRPEMRNESELHSYTVRCPNIDIISIGAGGGSIAHIDEAGGVRIGPESAGADPGPACYGRGGTRPTVTDCNLVLGHVDPTSFIGGDFALDRAAAETAIRTHLAEPLGVTVEEAALTVRQVANALMAQAMRLVTVERGYDPRDFVYVPYGGAGPVHAVDLARELDVPTVVLPPMPGVFSAFGMLVSDMKNDTQASIVENVSDLDADRLNAVFADLEKAAAAPMRAAGLADTDIVIERRADCQYLGQGQTMPVSVAPGTLDAAGVGAIGRDFQEEHRRHWNFDIEGRPVRIVNARVTAIGKVGAFLSPPARKRNGEALAPAGTARVHFDDGIAEVPRYRRDDLCIGDRVEGPLVVEELSSRIAIASGDALEVMDDATIVITVGKR
ncbi:hydantoinase/oxoprolinase family protein [Acuticoccus sediminis]|uniref:hydantoinase/oxoprolinase family protein n=1 Tax=Acuticoccus sediminis TaxID=2184697 RepID=UPI001CFCD055|nr:hydantoinase/oxoprolinase family protein [Acuticoccus sediminis]